MADQTAPADMRRHHQNNLDHARQVYLSLLFSTPMDMWFDDLEKVKIAIAERLGVKKD